MGLQRIGGLMLTCKIHMIGHRWTLETEGKIVLIVNLRTFLQHNLGGFSSSPVKYREMF